MYLSNQSLLVIIVVGVVAGYLAGRVLRGGGLWADRRFGRRPYRRIHWRLAPAAPWYSSRGRHCGLDRDCVHRRGHSPADPSFGRRIGLSKPMALVAQGLADAVRGNEQLRAGQYRPTATSAFAVNDPKSASQWKRPGPEPGGTSGDGSAKAACPAGATTPDSR